MVLGKKFFNRPVLKVAPELLGKNLCRKFQGGEVDRFKITEVEAYDGEKDLASHASRGRTGRTEVMYGHARHWYVYLVYGMHEMLNIVTGPKDYPAAVLIRGVEGISGPGRLTKTLKIGRRLNGKSATKKSGLWIEDERINISQKNIQKTARIGVNYAGPIWSKKKYRFILKGK